MNDGMRYSFPFLTSHTHTHQQGRVRALADHFSEKLQHAVVVPKLQPPMGKGTDDDALPPDFQINETTMPTFLNWIKSNGTETFTKRNKDLIAYLQKEGFDTFLACGTCWGGWACFRCAQDFPNLLNAINIWHPSVQLEGLLGGDPIELAKSVKCPVYFHICKNDMMALYDNNYGKIVKALRSNNIRCMVDMYPDMTHGFMTRGDAKNKKIKRDLKKGVERGISFFSASDHKPCGIFNARNAILAGLAMRFIFCKFQN